MKNSDLPINPVRGADNTPFDSSDADYLKTRKVVGLTKREYFAGLAMQGLLSNPDPQTVAASYEDIVRTSVEASDQLLKELGE